MLESVATKQDGLSKQMDSGHEFTRKRLVEMEGTSALLVKAVIFSVSGCFKYTHTHTPLSRPNEWWALTLTLEVSIDCVGVLI